MNEHDALLRRLRHRRVTAAAMVVTVVGGCSLAGGHAGAHAARSLVLPGAGLYGVSLAWGLACTAAALAATVAWVRWGAGWLVVAVTLVATGLSYRWATPSVAPPIASGALAAASPVATRLGAAHEFPLVVAVLGGLGMVRSAAARLPGAGRLRVRRQPGGRVGGIAGLDHLHPVDRARAVLLYLRAGSDLAAEDRRTIRASMARADVDRRVRWISVIARGRLGTASGRDLALLRTARAATDLIVPADDIDRPGATERRAALDRLAAVAADAERQAAGVAAEEPGWVRTLDATLTCTALQRIAGQTQPAARCATLLDSALALRHGHRPGSWWTPLGVAGPKLQPWEHAVTVAVAHADALLDVDTLAADWIALRRRALGAAARGARSVSDERLVAASRLLAIATADRQAIDILARPTIGRDPLADALGCLTRAAADTPQQPCSQPERMSR